VRLRDPKYNLQILTTFKYLWDWESLNTTFKYFSSKHNTSSMNLKIPFTTVAPPIFDGINYQVWAVRIEAYLDVNDLC